MRFDLAALWRWLSANALSSRTNVAAAGGATLAILTVVYAIWPGSSEIPADAVVVTGPMYTPVAVTPPAPTVAARQPAPGDSALSETRFNDDVNITRSVQRQLKRAGCYDGPISGVWSAPTRRAMAEFTSRVNARLPVGRPDPVLLVLLESNQSTSCTEALPPAGKDEQRAAERRGEVGPEEVAGIEEARPSETRDAREATKSLDAASPAVAGEEKSPPEGSAGRFAASELAAAGPIDETAALAAAAAAGQAAKPAKEGRRTARKYRKQNSLSRQVSKGFRNLQRTLNKLF